MPDGAHVKFKTERIRLEWAQVHPELRLAVMDLADYAFVNFAKTLTITCAIRTFEENAAIKGVADSLHTVLPCRAVDVRRSIFTPEQSIAIKDYFYSKYPHKAGWDCVLEGPPYNRRAPHFHVEREFKR